jgi:hypothetical protein
MKPRSLILIVALLVVLLAACSPAATPSPTPLASPTTEPTQPPAAPGTVLWTFPTRGEVWSSPAVKDGVAYFGSDDQSLYAVDIRTHNLKWSFPTEAIVRSRPAVMDGAVFFSSDDGYLFAVDAATGKQAWKFDLGLPRQSANPSRRPGITCSLPPPPRMDWSSPGVPT